MHQFVKCLKENPCIAILRGLDLEHASAVGELLYKSGIRLIEVPLNKAGVYECIKKLVQLLPDDCLIGAGTVISTEQVVQVSEAGGKFIISPNTSTQVIQAALKSNLMTIPGVSSVTEAYTAYQAGAHYLKLFPAATYGINHLSAMATVLPNDAFIIPVGGINSANLGQWLDAGAVGVGIGNDLYRCGDSIEQVKVKLAAVTSALLKYNDKSH